MRRDKRFSVSAIVLVWGVTVGSFKGSVCLFGSEPAHSDALESMNATTGQLVKRDEELSI